MSRLDFVRPGGHWTDELVLSCQDLQRLDARRVKVIGGDHGGSWTPSSPIVIGGAGISCTNFQASGGVATATGGRLAITSGAGDAPALIPSRAYTRHVPILNCRPPVQLTSAPMVATFDDQKGWGVSCPTASGLVYVTFEIPGRYMHIGARIARYGINFYVSARPSALPANAMVFDMASYGVSGAAETVPYPSGLIGIRSWSAGHAATLTSSDNTFWAPSSQTTNVGYYYACTNVGTGTTAGAEPSWPATVGATVSDANGVQWTCIGRNGWYPFHNATPVSYYANGDPQTLWFDSYGNFMPGFTSTVTNIPRADQRYGLTLGYVDPTVVFTSLTLEFDSIGWMAFE